MLFAWPNSKEKSMSTENPVYFIFACVIVGSAILLGMGLLFVRAENIERRNLVAGCTLGASLLAVLLLWNSDRGGHGVPAGIAWSAIALSVFGFVVGRVLDLVLGGRRRVHRDDATLG